MAAKPQKSPESARALGAGLTFAVTVALFALGGLWLDGKLATSPLFVLVGTLIGILGGTIHLLRVLSPESLPFGSRPQRMQREAKGRERTREPMTTEQSGAEPADDRTNDTDSR